MLGIIQVHKIRSGLKHVTFIIDAVDMLFILLYFHSIQSIKIDLTVEFLWVDGVGWVGWDVVVSKGTQMKLVLLSWKFHFFFNKLKENSIN